MLGDKACSSRADRAHLRRRKTRSCIPEPADQQGHRKRRGSRGGRPVGYDREVYKGRNVVERAFDEDKQWRSLATRYDKLAIVYRAGAVLRAITLWLKRSRDTLQQPTAPVHGSTQFVPQLVSNRGVN